MSNAFHQATDGMINSYSKKTHLCDNACIEAFHALLKREWINLALTFLAIGMHISWYLSISKHLIIQCGATVIVDIFPHTYYEDGGYEIEIAYTGE